MNPEEMKKRIGKLRAKAINPESENKSKFSKIKKLVKKSALVGATALAIAGISTFYLSRDYLIKRQDYPERNVLYRSSEIINVAGNINEGTGMRADKEETIKFFEGTGLESKVGTYLFETSRELRGDIDSYAMYNSQMIRIATALQKTERFQAGIRLNGSLNYREQFAELISGAHLKSPEKYSVYKLSPERGFADKDIDVVENTDHSRTIVNRLVEMRSFPLGWFFGKANYRAGTLLEDYGKDEDNKSIEKDILEKIRILDSPESTQVNVREKLVNDIINLEKNMSYQTIYSSFEGGWLKILPQKSTVYLGEFPSKTERAINWAGIGTKKHDRLVIENNWDLWPGYIPILNKISIGSEKDSVYPFDKYNNGGYVIKDKFGAIAQIQIEDFVLKYGQDVIYNYFLDLNGDGKIDKKTELIGKVLCKTTHDERQQIEDLGYGKRPDRDTTFTINYSFMSPTEELKKGMEYFKLCAFIESLMPDQVHRGIGQHSLLGLINNQRSDIMLYNDLNNGNLSRALTQESTLAAKYDIIRVLNAAHRPYASELAEKYGIKEEFECDYNSSDLLRERMVIGPLPGLCLALATVAGGAYYLRRRKLLNEKNVSDRIKEIKEK